MLSFLSFQTLANFASKTHKASAKRFRRLANGAYKYGISGQNHNYGKKSTNARTRIRQGGITCDWMTKRLRQLNI